jgi:hypothetical protein
MIGLKSYGIIGAFSYSVWLPEKLYSEKQIYCFPWKNYFSQKSAFRDKKAA